MSPVVHALIGWIVAILILQYSRDRRLAVIAGVIADIDGVFILFSLDMYQQYHHTFGHSLVFGIPVALIAMAVAQEKLKTFVACVGAFCMHLICDIIGTNWGILPFYPFSDLEYSIYPTLDMFAIYVVVNTIAFAAVIAIILVIMYKKEISPAEFFTEKLDKRFVSMYIYPFKFKCENCGKRAFTYCRDCGMKVCSHDLASLWTCKCKKCGKKKKK